MPRGEKQTRIDQQEASAPLLSLACLLARKTASELLAADRAQRASPSPHLINQEGDYAKPKK